jgi:hypothetical protein
VSTYETVTDERGRLSLGKAGAQPGRRYRVEELPDGEIRLTPMVSVPEREVDLLLDHNTRQRIVDGLAQAERGETRDRGDFTQYAVEQHSGSD